jgi:hypothetical protein
MLLWFSHSFPYFPMIFSYFPMVYGESFSHGLPEGTLAPRQGLAWDLQAIHVGQGVIPLLLSCVCLSKYLSIFLSIYLHMLSVCACVCVYVCVNLYIVCIYSIERESVIVEINTSLSSWNHQCQVWPQGALACGLCPWCLCLCRLSWRVVEVLRRLGLQDIGLPSGVAQHPMGNGGFTVNK